MADLKKEFGKKVRAYRSGEGLTQADLAERLDITEAHLGAIERGERWVSLTVLEGLAQCFRVSPREFFPASLKATGKRESLLMQTETSLAALTDKELEMAVRLLRAIKGK